MSDWMDSFMSHQFTSCAVTHQVCSMFFRESYYDEVFSLLFFS